MAFAGPKNRVGPKGDPGKPGTDGRDGADGLDGSPGKKGKDGSDGKDGVTKVVRAETFGVGGPRELDFRPLSIKSFGKLVDFDEENHDLISACSLPLHGESLTMDLGEINGLCN